MTTATTHAMAARRIDVRTAVDSIAAAGPNRWIVHHVTIQPRAPPTATGSTASTALRAHRLRRVMPFASR